MKCIFCFSETNGFTTKEHIIPESLGNTDDILTQGVCDKCQNYLALKVEKKALSDTPFSFWRTFYGISTKKKKSPFYDVNPAARKIIDRPDGFEILSNEIIFHPASSHNGSAVIQVDILNDKILDLIRTGKKTQFSIVLSPDKLIAMGRLLGKIALEYYYKEFGEKVFDPKFDDLRRYVRIGTYKTVWPLLHCQLKGQAPVYETDENGETETVELYRFGLFEIINRNIHFFVFQIGGERWGVLMSSETVSSEILEMLVDLNGNRFIVIS